VVEISNAAFPETNYFCIYKFLPSFFRFRDTKLDGQTYEYGL